MFLTILRKAIRAGNDGKKSVRGKSLHVGSDQAICQVYGKRRPPFPTFQQPLKHTEPEDPQIHNHMI